MKTTFIALLLLILPGLCFGQKDETEIREDIAEAVFRYEFQHFQKDVIEKSHFKSVAEFKATHFAITSGDAVFSVYKSGIVSRFTDVSPPVITVSESIDNAIHGIKCHAITIEIKKISINQNGTAVVETIITLEGNSFWKGLFNVIKKDGNWVPSIVKRRMGVGD